MGMGFADLFPKSECGNNYPLVGVESNFIWAGYKGGKKNRQL